MRKLFFLVVLGILLIPIIYSVNVSATDNCCEKTVSGDFCIYTDQAQCDPSFKSAPTSCEQTSYCQLGCGVSQDQGRCFQNVPRALAENKGATVWKPSATCEIPECVQGCCIIGTECSLATETKCEMVTAQFPYTSMDFREEITSETECIQTCKSEQQGCCVEDSGTCTYTTRQLCNVQERSNMTYGFFDDIYCSDQRLSCECVPQHHKACVGEDVYWFDSCGNPEGIAQDCNYAAGTLCKEIDEANAVCESLTCEGVYQEDTSPNSGSNKKNGESWCLYDGAVGQGRDLPGSRQYRSICINGEVVVEDCKDFREEMCVQGVMGSGPLSNQEALGALSGDYIEARCRENRNTDCFSCNPTDPTFEEINSQGDVDKYKDDLQRAYECCTEISQRDCYWLGENDVFVNEYDVAREDIKFPGMCVPEIPSGQQFWGEDNVDGEDAPDSAEESGICAAASVECDVTFASGGWNSLTKGFIDFDSDNWHCVKNCQCLDKEWIQAQNTVCLAQGDCGAYYNIEGKFSKDGFSYNSVELTDADKGKWKKESGVYLTPNEVMDFKTHQFPTQFGAPSAWSEMDSAAGFALLLGWAIQGAYGYHLGKFQGIIPWFGTGYRTAQAAYKEGATLTSARQFGITTTLTQAEVAKAITQTQTYQNTYSQIYRENIIEAWEDHGLSWVDGGGELTIPELEQYAIKDGVNLEQVATSSNQDAVTKTLANPELAKEGFTKSGETWTQTSTAQGSGLMQTFNTIMWLYTIYQIIDIIAADEKTETVQVNCMPWTPPKGGDDCELCNDDVKTCSEYRCRALGKNCVLINEGSGNESCINQHPNDVSAPIITPLRNALTPGYGLEETRERGNPGYTITPRVPAFTPISFGITTDEPAQCKMSTNHSIAYDNMPGTYFGTNLYTYDHQISLALPSPEQTTDEQIIKLINGETVTAYLRCTDANGNSNENDYFIRFNIDPSPDLTPPVIEGTSLINGALVPASQEETELRTYINEPAQCKWDFKDLEFEDMTKEFNCADKNHEISSVYYGLYECVTDLTNVTERETKNYYFRCLDNQGNVNGDSYQFSLKGTIPLNLVSIGPSGDQYTNNVTLKVITENGAENGKAICGFMDTPTIFENMNVFFETDSSIHSQSLILDKADYTYYVTCRDVAGNQIETNTTFRVTSDTAGPKITYLYTGATLYLETDEISTCEYNDKKFTWGEGTRMLNENAKGHEASLNFDKFYVLCQDQFENEAEYIIYV